MPALTIDRLIKMNEYTLTKQNRWLVMGCILDFRTCLQSLKYVKLRLLSGEG